MYILVYIYNIIVVVSLSVNTVIKNIYIRYLYSHFVNYIVFNMKYRNYVLKHNFSGDIHKTIENILIDKTYLKKKKLSII